MCDDVIHFTKVGIVKGLMAAIGVLELCDPEHGKDAIATCVALSSPDSPSVEDLTAHLKKVNEAVLMVVPPNGPVCSTLQILRCFGAGLGKYVLDHAEETLLQRTTAQRIVKRALALHGLLAGTNLESMISKAKMPDIYGARFIKIFSPIREIIVEFKKITALGDQHLQNNTEYSAVKNSLQVFQTKALDVDRLKFVTLLEKAIKGIQTSAQNQLCTAFAEAATRIGTHVKKHVAEASFKGILASDEDESRAGKKSESRMAIVVMFEEGLKAYAKTKTLKQAHKEYDDVHKSLFKFGYFLRMLHVDCECLRGVRIAFDWQDSLVELLLVHFHSQRRYSFAHSCRSYTKYIFFENIFHAQTPDQSIDVTFLCNMSSLIRLLPIYGSFTDSLRNLCGNLKPGHLLDFLRNLCGIFTGLYGFFAETSRNLYGIFAETLIDLFIL